MYLKVSEIEQNDLVNELLDNIKMKIYLDGDQIYDVSAKVKDYSGEGVNLQDALYIGDYDMNQISKLVIETELVSKYSNTENEEYS